MLTDGYVDCLYRIDVKSCLIVFIGVDMAMADCARNALKVHLFDKSKIWRSTAILLYSPDGRVSFL